MIRLTDARVDLGGQAILRGVDLRVADGEWVAVVGPNGAGKSTLLRLLAGLVHGSGELVLDGRPASAAAAAGARPARRPRGAVADDPRGGHRGRLRAARAHAAHRHARHGGPDRPRRRPRRAGCASTCSGSPAGSSPRCRVASASGCSSPGPSPRGRPIVLLDEPTSALDVGHQQQVLELVDQLRRDHGLTVVTTMHDLTLAGQYADRLAAPRRGRGRGGGPRRRGAHRGQPGALLRRPGPDRPRRRPPRRPAPAGRSASMTDDPTGIPTEHAHPAAAAPAVGGAGPHRRRQGQVVLGVRRRAARRRPRLAGRRSSSSSSRASGRSARRRCAASGSASTGTPSARASRGSPTDLTEDQAVAAEAWRHARRVIEAGEHRLVVLDEITYPMNWDWITPTRWSTSCGTGPSRSTWCSPGVTRPRPSIDVADTVTEMRKVKHAYDTRRAGQEGHRLLGDGHPRLWDVVRSGEVDGRHRVCDRRRAP